MDGCIAIVFDGEREVLARVRVLPGGHLIADLVEGDGFGRVFTAEWIIDVVSAA